MTRAPINPDDPYWEYRWRWVCDTKGCDSATEPVRRADLPGVNEMRAAGWFVAEVWADECPKCVAAKAVPGRVETVTVGSGVL